jgi:hypothetical protein
MPDESHYCAGQDNVSWLDCAFKKALKENCGSQWYSRIVRSKLGNSRFKPSQTNLHSFLPFFSSFPKGWRGSERLVVWAKTKYTLPRQAIPILQLRPPQNSLTSILFPLSPNLARFKKMCRICVSLLSLLAIYR